MYKPFNIIYYEFLGTRSRNFNIVPQVLSLSKLTEKISYENRTFNECAFSFILDGDGFYKRFGKTWKVKAPCVITQWPGDIIEYGPYSKWEEIFISYHKDNLNTFIKAGFLNKEKPVWEINNFSIVKNELNELIAFLLKLPITQSIDSIDTICMKIIIDSLTMPIINLSQEDKTILEIKAKIDSEILRNWNIQELAHMANMSISTFRRYWLKVVEESPKQYIINRKIEIACQFLQDSTMRNKAIANTLHFDNYYYFSKLFKKKIGVSPREFRRNINQ